MPHDGHHHDRRREGSELSPLALRVKALESLLVEKGYVDPAALDVLIETYETQDRPAQRRPRGGEGLDRSGLRRLAEARRHRRHRLAGLCRPPGRAHGGAVQHARDPQHGRLHAVLLLPVAGAGPAAGLVQVDALPLARRDRAARGAGRVRRDAARRNGGPRLGFDRRGPLSRDPRAARRHRRLERGAARRNSSPAIR